jgi:hypothetical protein
MGVREQLVVCSPIFAIIKRPSFNSHEKIVSS